jgi:MYXO-CTERM domain-containing protein
VKKAALLFLLCIALGATCASASIVGTTDSNLFQDHVDWCVQFNNCANTPFTEPSPSAFTSTGGVTGFVGNVGTQEPFEVRQQGVSWSGNFPANMGIVYNGVSTINNDPSDIAATFGVGVFGAGAYIQAEHFGAFTATVTLFDSSFQSLGSFTAQGDSENTGSALFIGAYDTTADVYAIQFSVKDINGADDFAIGTLGLQTSSVPEPGTLMLLGPSALGLLGVVRRRMNRKSQEVL